MLAGSSNSFPAYGQQQQGYQQGGYQQQHYPPPPQQHYAPQAQQGAPQHGAPQQGAYQQQPSGTQYQQHGQQLTSGGITQSAVPEGQDSGSYRNLTWIVKHRNTNSTLNVQLGQGDLIKSKPGAMIHMSPSVTLQGKIKVSMKKLFTGGSMAESTYTGPGLVALAPTLFGDIVTLNVGKDAFLARTSEVVKDTKSQGLGKAFFSGEDLFIYKFTGQGVVWLTSYGAIETKQVSLTVLN